MNRRTHKLVKVEQAVARGGGVLERLSPLVELVLVLFIVEPIDVD